MKSKFPGYFKLSKEEVNNLWENALFTLDANILLNLYRYSDETRDEFFKILTKIKDRVWIPHQSAQEFFNNRLNVINQQEKAYEEAISSLKSMENEFKNSRQHPFIHTKLLEKFSSLSGEICKQLESSKTFHNNRILDDDILSTIESIFDSKVGEEYNNEKLQDIYNEAKVRFEGKIPPGYKDSSKKDDTNQDVRRYGDYIVWKQIIEKSKELKQGVILVTDDRKEDWWVRFKGKTLSPRPELIKEFKSNTEQSFHMYQSDKFLEYARDFLGEDINERAIEEIRELRRLDERIRLSRKRKEQEMLKLREFSEFFLKERMSLEEELSHIKAKINYIEDAINNEYLILDNSDPSEYDERKLITLKNELAMLISKSEHTIQKIESIKEKEYIEKNIRNKTLHNNAYKSYRRTL